MKGMGEVHLARKKAYLFVFVCLEFGARSLAFAEPKVFCPNPIQEIYGKVVRNKAKFDIIGADLADVYNFVIPNGKNKGIVIKRGSTLAIRQFNGETHIADVKNIRENKKGDFSIELMNGDLLTRKQLDDIVSIETPPREWRDIGKDLAEVSESRLDGGDIVVMKGDLVRLSDGEIVRIESIRADKNGKAGFKTQQGILIEEDFAGSVIERTGPDGRGVVVKIPVLAKGITEFKTVNVDSAQLLDGRVIKRGSKIKFTDEKNPGKTVEVTLIKVDPNSNQVVEITLSDWRTFKSDGRSLLDGQQSFHRATIDYQGPTTGRNVVRRAPELEIVPDVPKETIKRRTETVVGEVEVKDPLAHRSNKRPEPQDGQNFDEANNAVLPDGRTVSVSRDNPQQSSLIVFADGSQASPKAIHVDTATFEIAYIELDTGKFLLPSEFEQVHVDLIAPKPSRSVARTTQNPPMPDAVKLSDGAVAKVVKGDTIESEQVVSPPRVSAPSANWKKVGGYSGQGLKRAMLSDGKYVTQGDKFTLPKLGELEVTRIAKGNDKKTIYIELSNGVVVRDAVFQKMSLTMSRAKTEPPVEPPSGAWAKVGGYNGKAQQVFKLPDGRVVRKGQKARVDGSEGDVIEIVRIAPAATTNVMHFELSDGRVVNLVELKPMLPLVKAMPPVAPSVMWRHVGGNPIGNYQKYDVGDGRVIESGAKVITSDNTSITVVRIAQPKNSKEVFVELSNGTIRAAADFAKMKTGALGEFVEQTPPAMVELTEFKFKDGRVLNDGSVIRTRKGNYLAVKSILESGKGQNIRAELSDGSIVSVAALEKMKSSDGVDFDDFLPEVPIAGRPLQQASLKKGEASFHGEQGVKAASPLVRGDEVLTAGAVRRRVQTIEASRSGETIIHFEDGSSTEASKLHRMPNGQIVETAIAQNIAETTERARRTKEWKEIGDLSNLKDVESAKVTDDTMVRVGDLMAVGHNRKISRVLAIKENAVSGSIGIEFADGQVVTAKKAPLRVWSRAGSTSDLEYVDKMPMFNDRYVNVGDTVILSDGSAGAVSRIAQNKTTKVQGIELKNGRVLGVDQLIWRKDGNGKGQWVEVEEIKETKQRHSPVVNESIEQNANP